MFLTGTLFGISWVKSKFIFLSSHVVCSHVYVPSHSSSDYHKLFTVPLEPMIFQAGLTHDTFQPLRQISLQVLCMLIFRNNNLWWNVPFTSAVIQFFHDTVLLLDMQPNFFIMRHPIIRIQMINVDFFCANCEIE